MKKKPQISREDLEVLVTELSNRYPTFQFSIEKRSRARPNSLFASERVRTDPRFFFVIVADAKQNVEVPEFLFRDIRRIMENYDNIGYSSGVI